MKQATKRRGSNRAGFKRRRIAVAVQLAFVVSAGVAAIAPAHAANTACPSITDTVTLSANATNTTDPCIITSTGTLNTGGFTLDNNNPGVLNNSGSLNINAGGTLNNNWVLRNDGSLTNNVGGTLTNSYTLNNDNRLYNFSGATLTNSGTLNNNSYLRNDGGLINNAGGTLNNYSDLRNYGGLTNNAGGTLNNSGDLRNYSGATLTNSGTLDNTSLLRNYGGLTNNAGGTLNNSGTLNNFSGATLTNSGTLNNYNRLYNYSGATLTNSGTLNNNYFLRNDGSLTNSAGGTLNNNNGGTLISNNYLRNYGSLTNSAGGTLNNSGSLFNNSGATLANSGTLNNTNDLRNYGSLTNAAGGTLNNDGYLRNNSGATLTNSGTLNNGNDLWNFGSLTNAAGGTLNNSGSLWNYSGATLTNSGTLNNSFILRNFGSLTNAAGATLDNSGVLSNYLSATLTNSGTLNTNLLRNDGSLTNAAGGTLNNYRLYNYSGATLANSGTLNNSFILRNDGSLTNAAGGVLNNDGFILNFSGATLTNSGTLNNNGTLSNDGTLANSGALTVSAARGLTGTGTLTQSAGTLQVDGSLTQSALTINGGTLAGTGTITAPVTNSATLLPGAPGAPGTLTINGSLTQNPSAVLVVNVTPTLAAQVAITGPATLAGTVQVVPGTGSFAPTTNYTILTASGGVTGTFSGVSSTSAFLTPSLAYDPNNVYLELVRTAALGSVALTPNQMNVSALLDRIQTGGGGDADMQSVIGVLNGLSADEARAAYDSIAGAGLIAAFGGQFALSEGFRGAIGSRLDTAGAGGGAGLLATGSIQLAAANTFSDANPVYAQAAGRPAAGSRADARGVWVRVSGNEGDTSGDGNAAGYRQRGGGLAIGADTEVNERLRAGAAVNIGTQRVRGDASSGNVDTEGVSAAVYAKYTDGPVTLKGIAGAGRNSNDSSRTVAFGGLTRTASADYKSTQQFAYAEAAYSLPRGSFTLQPLAAVGYTRVKSPAYTETGAGALNLMVQSQARESTRSYLGARAIFKLDTGGTGLRLEPRVLWSHEFGNGFSAPAAAQLAGAPAAGAFQVQGPGVKRDGVVLGLGASGEVRKNVALFADVSAELKNGQSNAALFVGARSTW